MIEDKICKKTCFNYNYRGRGCSYTSKDFRASEKIKPGQKCLHPEFSHSELLVITPGKLYSFFTDNYSSE